MKVGEVNLLVAASSFSVLKDLEPSWAKLCEKSNFLNSFSWSDSSTTSVYSIYHRRGKEVKIRRYRYEIEPHL